MAKIYCKNSLISFDPKTNDPETTVVETTNKTLLQDFVIAWLNDENREDVCISGYSHEQMEADFKEMFYYLEAAGGVVFNPRNQVLFIYRSGLWDLPKGKIDKNEQVEDCALREVEEETGVNDLRITESLKYSYHIYLHKKKWYLKKTFWFFMETSFDGVLKPQLEEEITEAKWMSVSECRAALKQTYRSLRESIGDGICSHFDKQK